MVSVAEVASPNDDRAPDSVPRRIFEVVPDVEIELESLVPLGRRAIPYVRVRGDGLDAFEAAIAGFDRVRSVDELDRGAGGGVFRVDWDVDSPLLQCIDRAGGSVMGAHGTAERWSLEVWFECGDDASAFQRCCRGRDVPLEVQRIRSTADEGSRDESPITGPQREALETAHEVGYFDRPRRETQAELAELLGISASATGDRLRRGTANLVESMLQD